MYKRYCFDSVSNLVIHMVESDDRLTPYPNSSGEYHLLLPSDSIIKTSNVITRSVVHLGDIDDDINEIQLGASIKQYFTDSILDAISMAIDHIKEIFIFRTTFFTYNGNTFTFTPADSVFMLGLVQSAVIAKDGGDTSWSCTRYDITNTARVFNADQTIAYGKAAENNARTFTEQTTLKIGEVMAKTTVDDVITFIKNNQQ